jgi:hypothetical protein
MKKVLTFLVPIIGLCGPAAAQQDCSKALIMKTTSATERTVDQVASASKVTEGRYNYAKHELGLHFIYTFSLDGSWQDYQNNVREYTSIATFNR